MGKAVVCVAVGRSGPHTGLSKVQVECGATKTVINSTQPMAPAVPRAPQASFPVSGLAPFRHFFFCLLGGYLRPRATARVFHAQGGSWGVWGRTGAVQGPPIDPSTHQTHPIGANDLLKDFPNRSLC